MIMMMMIIIIIIIIMMMIMMMMMIIITMIIMILKGTVEIVHNLLTALQSVSNMYAQVARVQSSVNNARRIRPLSHVTNCVPYEYEGATQLLSLFCWLKPLTTEKREGNQSTRRKPLMTSFTKCYILEAQTSPRWCKSIQGSVFYHICFSTGWRPGDGSTFLYV